MRKARILLDNITENKLSRYSHNVPILGLRILYKLAVLSFYGRQSIHLFQCLFCYICSNSVNRTCWYSTRIGFLQRCCCSLQIGSPWSCWLSVLLAIISVQPSAVCLLLEKYHILHLLFVHLFNILLLCSYLSAHINALLSPGQLSYNCLHCKPF